MSTEATLVAVAFTIYLADCIVLLERGQALWSSGFAGTGLSFGSLHYQVRGRVVALLNPFTPFAAAFRTLPLFAASSGIKATDASRALAPAAVLGLLQFVLVLAALPYCLYQAPGLPFFLALVATYLNAIVLLLLIWRRFRRAGIAARPLAALGFGWLACLPLSINAMRKAGLSIAVAMDAREAISLLPVHAQERARGELAAQVAEALQELEETDAQHGRLSDLRRQLTATSHG